MNISHNHYGAILFVIIIFFFNEPLRYSTVVPQRDYIVLASLFHDDSTPIFLSVTAADTISHNG